MSEANTTVLVAVAKMMEILRPLSSEANTTVLVAVAKMMEILRPLSTRDRGAAMEVLLGFYTDPSPVAPEPKPEVSAGTMEFMDAPQQAAAAVRALSSSRDKMGVKSERVAKKLGITNAAASARLLTAEKRGLVVRVTRGRYVAAQQ